MQNINLKSPNSNILKICFSILKIEYLIYKKIFLDKIINLAVWIFTWMGISNFIMNKIIISNSIGMDYGIFMFSGLCAGVSFFELYAYIMEIIFDLEGNKIIESYLILPIKQEYILFVKLILFPTLIFILNTVWCFIVGFFCFSGFSFLKNTSFISVFFMAISSSLFFTSFGFFISTLIKSRRTLSNAWNRIIFPLWFTGCFQYPWDLLSKKLPYYSYLILCNPIVYATEGFRSAIMQLEIFIHWKYCCLILLTSSIILIYFSIFRFLKRLETVN